MKSAPLVRPCPNDGLFGALIHIAGTAKHLNVPSNMSAATLDRYDVIELQLGMFPTIRTNACVFHANSGQFCARYSVVMVAQLCATVDFAGVFIVCRQKSQPQLSALWVLLTPAAFILPCAFRVATCALILSNPFQVCRTPFVVRNSSFVDVVSAVRSVVCVLAIPVSLIPSMRAFGFGFAPLRVQTFNRIVFVVTQDFAFAALPGFNVSFAEMPVAARLAGEIA